MLLEKRTKENKQLQQSLASAPAPIPWRLKYGIERISMLSEIEQKTHNKQFE